MAKREYQFCPFDKMGLIKQVIEGEEFLACPKDGCGYVHWDNPIPTVATLVAMPHYWLNIAGISTAGIPNNGIVLIRRGIPPFKGEWCLPCGYISRHGHPKAEAVKEVREETGLETRIEQLICVCNPMAGEVNVNVVHYLARPVGGVLQAGDDAEEVGVFSEYDLPKICFRSHAKVVRHWFSGDLGKLTGDDLVI